MSAGKPLVSVIIPALNEEDGIVRTLERLPVGTLRKSGYEVEVLVVDGNSADATRDNATNNGAKVLVEHKKGYGRACRTGFTNARGDILVTADADNTYPTEMIPVLVDNIARGGYDFITTNRFHDLEDGAMSRTIRWGTWCSRGP